MQARKASGASFLAAAWRSPPQQAAHVHCDGEHEGLARASCGAAVSSAAVSMAEDGFHRRRGTCNVGARVEGRASVIAVA